MKKTKKVSWITTGTFRTRVAKESLVIFPFALMGVYYYGFVRSETIEFSIANLLLISGGLTLAIAAYNARKPAPQPQPIESEANAVLASRND